MASGTNIKAAPCKMRGTAFVRTCLRSPASPDFAAYRLNVLLTHHQLVCAQLGCTIFLLRKQLSNQSLIEPVSIRLCEQCDFMDCEVEKQLSGCFLSSCLRTCNQELQALERPQMRALIYLSVAPRLFNSEALLKKS